MRRCLRLSFLMILVFTVGCVIVREEGFTYREPVKMEDSPIRLDGYYYEVGDSSRITRGTAIYPLLLWEDGTAAYFTRGYAKTIKDNAPGPILQGSLAEARAVFEEKMDRLFTGKKSDPAQWGRFRIQGDSISLQVMVWDGSSLHDVYRTLEMSGKILNDTTFVLRTGRTFTGAYSGAGSINRRYHFCPLEEKGKPPSDNWTQTHPELQ